MNINIIENEQEEDRMLNDLFTSIVREKYVEIGEEKIVLPIYFNENWEKINKFEVRDDDVYITGHMKTGTTWVHEIVDLILNGVDSKDINTLRLRRHPYLDLPIMYNSKLPKVKFFSFDLNEEKSPRSIRTHLPWFLLPEQIRNGSKSPKIIHVLRNPKDTCTSFYYHSRSLDGYKGNFEEFCRLFLAGRLHYGPFFTNIKTYWKNRDNPNLLFVRYSDLKGDLSGMIRKIATFLGTSLSEREVQDLAEFVSLDSMKKHVGKDMDEFAITFAKHFNICVEPSSFIREGKEEGYKAVMSEELIQEFDKYTEKALAGTGLSF